MCKSNTNSSLILRSVKMYGNAKFPFGRRSFVRCYLFLLLFYTWSTFIVATDPLSATSPSPQLTPNPLADNKTENAKIALELKNILKSSLQSRIMASVHNTLTTSRHFKVQERKLSELLNIVLGVRTMFGIAPHPLMDKCSKHYLEKKKSISLQAKLLATVCREATENINVDAPYGADTLDSMGKAIFHFCAKDPFFIPWDMVMLTAKTYMQSHACAIDSVKNVLFKLAEFIEFTEVGTNLLIQELEYLLGVYKRHIERLGDAGLKKLRGAEVTNITSEVAFLASANSVKARRDAIAKYKSVIDPLNNPNWDNNLLAEYMVDEIAKPFLKTQHGADWQWNTSVEFQNIMWVYERINFMITKIVEHLPDSDSETGQHSDLSKGTMYTGISSTYGKRCENSPPHLVGTCTPENNEICRPLVDLGSSSRRMLDEIHIYPKETSIEIEEETPPRMSAKFCQCGFRTDCMTKMKGGGGSSKVCILIPNARGTCLGGVGYPCRTSPLADGQYDASCVSGYCDQEKDACTNHHRV